MKLFRWNKGRQGTGYDKFPILVSESLKCDFYVLKFPAGVEVPKHRDPVKPGYRHHRINYTFWGSVDKGQRMYILGKIKRWWRFEYFRPDVHEHGLPIVRDTMYMLSFGWLTKDKHGS